MQPYADTSPKVLGGCSPPAGILSVNAARALAEPTRRNSAPLTCWIVNVREIKFALRRRQGGRDDRPPR